MQHLVRCLEYMYFYSSRLQQFVQYNQEYNDEAWYFNYPAARRRFPDCLEENIPGAENATIDSFRDGFYRAMYRLLLAGAVLARVYMDPVFRAKEDASALARARFFQRWGSDRYWSDELTELHAQLDPNIIDDADFAYIRQSPVYNFDVPDWSEIGQWRDREYDACFGPFASWIVEDGRKREQNEPYDGNEIKPSWARNKADVGAVRELMLLLVAYDHLSHYFEGPPIRQPYMQKQGNRTATIVRFGEFLAKEITLPAAVEDLADTYIYSEDHPALAGTAGKDMSLELDLCSVKYFLESQSRTPIPEHKDHPGPPIELEFWNFALRRYLDLTFKSGTFWYPQLDCTWWREVGRGEVFLNPNWAVVQKYQPGVISWDHRNNQHL
jgi:hypothetical protein